MIYEKRMDSLMDKLAGSDLVSGIKLVKAYPYAIKATRLTSSVLCFSLGEISALPISVDNEGFSAQYQVDISLYSPFNLGSPYATDIMQRLVEAVVDEDIMGIKISAVAVDDSTGCFVQKCTLTYSYDYLLEVVANG